MKFRSIFLSILSLLSISPLLADNTLSNSSFFGHIGNGFTSVLDTIQSDLTINESDEQPTTGQNSLFKKALKACRVTAYCIIAKLCVGKLLDNYFPPSPNARQFDGLPYYERSWFRSVVVAPILEESVFTYVTSELFGSYAQIIAPVLFGAGHLSSYDRNLNIHLFTVSALINFIHQRVMRRNQASELPVAIMSHMLQNQIACFLKG